MDPYKELMLDDNGHLVRQCLLLHWHVGSYFLSVIRVVGWPDLLDAQIRYACTWITRESLILQPGVHKDSSPAGPWNYELWQRFVRCFPLHVAPSVTKTQKNPITIHMLLTMKEEWLKSSVHVSQTWPRVPAEWWDTLRPPGLPSLLCHPDCNFVTSHWKRSHFNSIHFKGLIGL